MPRVRTDVADFSGVALVSVDVGRKAKPARWQHRGYQYSTEGEHQLAVLLDAMGVPFLPDVSFALPPEDGRPRRYVPDFVFCGHAWLWVKRRDRVKLVHGFEAKRRVTERAKENASALWRTRHIRVLILSDEEIARFYRHHLAHPDLPPLPLLPLESK